MFATLSSSSSSFPQLKVSRSAPKIALEDHCEKPHRMPPLMSSSRNTREVCVCSNADIGDRQTTPRGRKRFLGSIPCPRGVTASQ